MCASARAHVRAHPLTTAPDEQPFGPQGFAEAGCTGDGTGGAAARAAVQRAACVGVGKVCVCNVRCGKRAAGPPVAFRSHAAATPSPLPPGCPAAGYETSIVEKSGVSGLEEFNESSHGAVHQGPGEWVAAVPRLHCLLPAHAHPQRNHTAFTHSASAYSASANPPNPQLEGAGQQLKYRWHDITNPA